MGFVRENLPSSGQVVILNNLSVKPHLFTDNLSILSQLFTVIGSWWQAGQPRTEKKLNIHADSPKLVNPSSGIARLSQSPYPMFFIGTLSQTLTLRAAFASSTYLLSQIPGPGRSSDDNLLIPTDPLFKGGDQGLRAFHRRTATLPANSGPASEDALFGTRGRRLRSRRA